MRDWQDDHPSPFYVWHPPIATAIPCDVWVHPVKWGAFRIWEGVRRRPTLSTTARRRKLSQRRQPCKPLLDPTLWGEYTQQRVLGPIQTDEAFFLHALVRTTGITRVLEIGGFLGHSARVFLDAMQCAPTFTMYTVDINPVPNVDPLHHWTIQKDAVTLTPADVGGARIELLFLDCHAFYATRAVVELMLRHEMLTPDAFVVLHDTGRNHDPRMRWTRNGIHQPVERLIAQWLSSSHGWQRLSFHDDRRKHGRHGLTVMQRKHNLSVPCDGWTQFFDASRQDCMAINRLA